MYLPFKSFKIRKSVKRQAEEALKQVKTSCKLYNTIVIRNYRKQCLLIIHY